MNTTDVEQTLDEASRFRSGAETVSRGVHNAVLQGGSRARAAADILHGTWLGHPLHPALTDVVVGAWTIGSLLNLLPRGNGDGKTARKLIGLGILGAIPTALAGVADYSTITKRAVSTGAAHGLLNTAALASYALAYSASRGGARRSSRVYSTIGLGLLAFSAWLGGKLVYAHKVGVNKAQRADAPLEWTDAAAFADLGEGRPRRVDLEGTPVLLCRRGSRVLAVGAVCSHEGGPLDEGEIREGRVQCPWHDSVFDLESGRVVHGPATHPVQRFEARVEGDRVLVRVEAENPGGAARPERGGGLPAERRPAS